MQSGRTAVSASVISSISRMTAASTVSQSMPGPKAGAALRRQSVYVADDLLTHTPIFGFNIGGYVDYMFTEWKNPWS